jgi:hypothetical protein
MSARHPRSAMLFLLALSLGPAMAWSQGKVDTANRNRPATQTTPPATRTVVPPKQAPASGTKAPANTAAPNTTPSKTASTPKTNPPPAAQQQRTAPPPQTKTVPGAAAPAAGRGSVPATPPRDTVIPSVMMREVFDYNREGRRDPFISLLTTSDLRPTLTDLRLLMTVVDEPGRSVALVQDAYDKRNPQKTLRVGQRLGRMRVSSIRSDAVVFTIEEFGMNRRDSLLLRDSTKARVGR